jgi:type IV secretory pathway TraG/TraD family ATPase VirD4
MGESKGAADKGGSPGVSDGLFIFVVIALALGLTYHLLSAWFVKVQNFVHLHSGSFTSSLIAAGGSLAVVGISVLRNRYLDHYEDKFVTSEDEQSVCLGEEYKTKKMVHLKAPFRTMHTQLIGTTNAGKTASVILPWAARDIELGRGLILIDGKADQGFLDKLYAQAVQAGRQKDCVVFTLANPHLSSTFNPFCQGTAEQITERVFSSFEFSDEYYKGIQFSAMRTVVALLMRRGQPPMPGVVRELLRDRKKLQGWLEGLKDANLTRDVLAITNDDDETFAKNYSGIVTALGHFSQGETATLFNTKHPEISLSDVLKNRKICYFQLPTMQFPYLGQATGKLLLQSLQSAISELQGSGSGRLDTLFSVYLDDFNDYIYPGFVSLLNKSRSANIGVVFAHQSLGDLEKVSPDFKQIVLTNTNIKIVMRSNDPESAEHFAKTIGTITSEKTTERRRSALLGQENTGDQSIREVEEYVFHPNIFKADLGLGEGVVIIPHIRGRIVKRIKFKTVPELPVLRMPIRDLPQVNFGEEATLGGNQTTVITSPIRGKGPKDESNGKKRPKVQNIPNAA